MNEKDYIEINFMPKQFDFILAMAVIYNFPENDLIKLLEKNPIDENLKNTDYLKGTGLMNNYKHCAEETILKELIYC